MGRYPIFDNCRSPSWGAWIEMYILDLPLSTSFVAPPRGERGLKICRRSPARLRPYVAPPRGERGLKYLCLGGWTHQGKRCSPSWGAWIEICLTPFGLVALACCSPSWGAWIEINQTRIRVLDTLPVAPPRGERGLKYNQGAV